MILVTMGEDNTRKLAQAVFYKLGIGKNDIDGRRRVVAEGDAKIDDQPVMFTRGAEPIKVEIHADFLGTTEWHE
jgi:hypothetical protein